MLNEFRLYWSDPNEDITFPNIADLENRLSTCSSQAQYAVGCCGNIDRCVERDHAADLEQTLWLAIGTGLQAWAAVKMNSLSAMCKNTSDLYDTVSTSLIPLRTRICGNEKLKCQSSCKPVYDEINIVFRKVTPSNCESKNSFYYRNIFSPFFRATCEQQQQIERLAQESKSKSATCSTLQMQSIENGPSLAAKLSKAARDTDKFKQACFYALNTGQVIDPKSLVSPPDAPSNEPATWAGLDALSLQKDFSLDAIVSPLEPDQFGKVDFEKALNKGQGRELAAWLESGRKSMNELVKDINPSDLPKFTLAEAQGHSPIRGEGNQKPGLKAGAKFNLPNPNNQKPIDFEKYVPAGARYFGHNHVMLPIVRYAPQNSNIFHNASLAIWRTCTKYGLALVPQCGPRPKEPVTFN